jgi:hypothetical protein
MSLFLERLEEEENQLDEQEDIVVEFLLNEADQEDLDAIKLESGMADDEFDEMMESLRKRVTSKGKVTKVRDRKTRKRRATLSTGLSKASLRRRARKASKTKRRNPAIQRKALKRKKRADRKRKQMGLR